MPDLEIYTFLQEFSKEEKELFYTLLRPISLSKDTIIHYQNDICKDILLLVKGSIRLYIQSDDFSEEVTLYTLNPGEQCLVNTASVIGQSKTIGTAVTQSEIQGYLLSKENIDKFMIKSPTYQRYLISLFSTKLYELTLSLHSVKFQNLDERIMLFFSKYNTKKIIITHSKLAKEMNTSRTVVSRVLKKLEKYGDIKLFRGYIELT